MVISWPQIRLVKFSVTVTLSQLIYIFFRTAFTFFEKMLKTLLLVFFKARNHKGDISRNTNKNCADIRKSEQLWKSELKENSIKENIKAL